MVEEQLLGVERAVGDAQLRVRRDRHERVEGQRTVRSSDLELRRLGVVRHIEQRREHESAGWKVGPKR
eukprot:4010375-Prymnesium_polylepis.2